MLLNLKDSPNPIRKPVAKNIDDILLAESYEANAEKLVSITNLKVVDINSDTSSWDPVYTIKLLTSNDETIRLYVDSSAISVLDETIQRFIKNLKNDHYINIENGILSYYDEPNDWSGYVIYPSQTLDIYYVNLSDEETVRYDKDLITVSPYITGVAKIDLERVGKYGSIITWETDNSDILNVDTGKITYPAQQTNIILTATLTKGDAVEIKTFELIIAP